MTLPLGFNVPGRTWLLQSWIWEWRTASGTERRKSTSTSPVCLVSRRGQSLVALPLAQTSTCSAMGGPPPMKWSDSKYGYATEEDFNGKEAQA